MPGPSLRAGDNSTERAKKNPHSRDTYILVETDYLKVVN